MRVRRLLSLGHRSNGNTPYIYATQQQNQYIYMLYSSKTNTLYDVILFSGVESTDLMLYSGSMLGVVCLIHRDVDIVSN